MKGKRKFFRFLWLFLLATVVSTASIWGCNALIQHFSAPFTFSETQAIPKNKVGVVMGTSKFLTNGNVNLYYRYRIRAAADLFKAGKVSYLLVSGDNHHHSYNEPRMMKQDLIKAGIPADAVHLDFAGFRTFDSVVRAGKVFGQQQFTVISQKFQNERAIYIGRHKGFSVVGYNARDVSPRYGAKVKMREVLARVKVFLDLFVINTQPRFLGQPISIG